jgi:hypothetical protein
MCLMLLGILQWATGGDFWFWTVTSLQNHKVDDSRVMEGLRYVWEFAPFSVAIPWVALVLGLKGLLSERSALWTGSLFVAVPASMLPYAKAGGYLNNLMPLIVLVGPVTAFLLADVARQRGGWGWAARWCVLLGLTLFVWNHPLNASDYSPTARNWRAARELNAIVASLKGGVVCPYLGFLPAHNGHSNPHWQSMVVWDSVWRGEPMNEIAALEHSGATWVLLHSKDGGSFASHVRNTSRLDRRIPDSARVQMVTGAAVEIDEVWERNLR